MLIEKLVHVASLGLLEVGGLKFTIVLQVESCLDRCWVLMMHGWIRIVPPSQEWIETTVLCCSNRHIMRICAAILSLLLQWKDIMLDESSDIPECLDFITCQLQVICQIHRACLYLSSRVQATRDANLESFDEILKLVGLILTVGDLLL